MLGTKSCSYKVTWQWAKEKKVMEDDFHLIHKSDLRTIAVCPPGFYAASPVRKWVHAPGISPESSEEGAGQEDALQRFHHERMVSQPLHPQNVCLRDLPHPESHLWNENRQCSGIANSTIIIWKMSLVWISASLPPLPSFAAAYTLPYSESWREQQRANEGAA